MKPQTRKRSRANEAKPKKGSAPTPHLAPPSGQSASASTRRIQLPSPPKAPPQLSIQTPGASDPHSATHPDSFTAQQLSISRSTLYATWAGVAVAAGIAVASFFYSYWLNARVHSEVVDVAHVRRLDHHPTTIQDSFNLSSDGPSKTGLLLAYWRIVLTNNGETRVALTSYEIRQLATFDELSFRSYSGLDAGLFICDEKFTPVNLSVKPVKLDPGDAATFCARVGVLMHPSAYALAVNQFPSKTIDDISHLQHYLWDNGLDVYGNTVKKEVEGAYSFGPIDSTSRQVFVASFTTSKNRVITTILQWYSFGQIETTPSR